MIGVIKDPIIMNSLIIFSIEKGVLDFKSVEYYWTIP